MPRITCQRGPALGGFGSASWAPSNQNARATSSESAGRVGGVTVRDARGRSPAISDGKPRRVPPGISAARSGVAVAAGLAWMWSGVGSGRRSTRRPKCLIPLEAQGLDDAYSHSHLIRAFATRCSGRANRNSTGTARSSLFANALTTVTKERICVERHTKIEQVSYLCRHKFGGEGSSRLTGKCLVVCRVAGLEQWG